MDKKVVDKNKIEEILIQSEKNVVITYFGEVGDMVESIFESMPELTL